MGASSLPGRAAGPAGGGLGIEFRHIEKRYGTRTALRDVSLEIGPGECVALLGANGSGKTTLLRIAALLARPTRGQLKYSGAGNSNGSNGAGGDGAAAIKRRIGFVAHQTLLYDELTAEENLLLFAELYGLEQAAGAARAALDLAGLGGRGADLVRTYSRGMRQRLTIVRALLASPALLLLDEPATGLDPAGQQWLAKRLGRLRGEGATILMSVHADSEAVATATRAVRLVEGKIAVDSGSAGDPGPVLRSSLAAGEERWMGGGR